MQQSCFTKMSNLKIIDTGDGSPTLLNPTINETYHSRSGALQESVYVFMDQGLKHYYLQKALENIRVFEVGYGTGLNAALVFNYALNQKIYIEYQAIDNRPLTSDIFNLFSYGEPSFTNNLLKINKLDWDRAITLNKFFSINKVNNTLENFTPSIDYFDIVFFDAFAPNKQPEMWSVEMLQKCFEMLKTHGIWITYSCTGQLKRNLKKLGFEVEIIPGPPGKREITRAIKNA